MISRRRYAKSIALGLAIGGSLKKPLAYVLVPTLAHLLPPEHKQRWSPIIVNYSCKAFAVMMAFWLQVTSCCAPSLDLKLKNQSSR